MYTPFCVGRHQTCDLGGIERTHINSANIVRATGKEQELSASWKELGMAMPVDAGAGVVAVATEPPAALTRRSEGSALLEYRMVPWPALALHVSRHVRPVDSRRTMMTTRSATSPSGGSVAAAKKKSGEGHR